MRRSALTLAALATAAVPGLDVVATRGPQHQGEDFAVTGVLDGGGRRWVVRCPQHPAAGAALEGEVVLLERLAEAVDEGSLPFDVPRPAGFAPLPEGGRAMVYRELQGGAINLDALAPGPHLAAQLGRALAAVHELPVGVVEAAGLPVYDPDAWRLRRLSELDEAARTGDVPRVLLARWEQALENVALWRFRPTPVHGDLAHEHVLVSGGDVAAVLDWSHAHVGDPAEDLAWIFAAAPEAALDTVLEAYSLARTERGDTHLAARATLASELALARWLLHGHRVADGGIVADARRMLADLAGLVEDAPGIGAAAPVVVADEWTPSRDRALGAAADAVPASEVRDAAPPLPDEPGARIASAIEDAPPVEDSPLDAADDATENDGSDDLTVEIPVEERPGP